MKKYTDDELRLLSNGTAEKLLHDRKQQRRERERKRAEHAAFQSAYNALASLGTEELQTLARDPREMEDTRRREAWESVPSEVWNVGMSKDEVVETAQSLAQERVEHSDRRRIRANQLPTDPPGEDWMWIAAGAVGFAYVLDQL